MWFGGGQTKSHIEEANRHLTELYKKISDLEEKLDAATNELKQKEADFTVAMQEVHEKRQLELKELNVLIYKQNLKLQRLEGDLTKRDTELAYLRKRCRMFDEVLRYKATLGKLTITMEQAEQFAIRNSDNRNQPFGYRIDPDCVNTEPAPLMILDSTQSNETSVKAQDDHSLPESSISNGLPEPKLLHLTNGLS